MAFDDDTFGGFFPTRHGEVVGRGLENRMLQNVGGAMGIRQKVITLPDGTTVRLRTRAGMPEFIAEKPKGLEETTDPFVWAYSYASVAAAANAFVSIYYEGDEPYTKRRAYATRNGGAQTLRYGLNVNELPAMEGIFWFDDVAGGYWYSATDVVAWQAKSYLPTINAGTFAGAYCDGYYGIGLFCGQVRLNEEEPFDVNGADAGVYAAQPTRALHDEVVAATSSVCYVCCACALTRVGADNAPVKVVRVLVRSAYPILTDQMFVRDYVDGVMVSEISVPYAVHLEGIANGSPVAVSTAGWSMDGCKLVLGWSQMIGEQTVFVILRVAEDGLSYTTETVSLGPVLEQRSTVLTSKGATTSATTGSHYTYNTGMGATTYRVVSKVSGSVLSEREIPPPNSYSIDTTYRRDLTAHIVACSVSCTDVGFDASGELCAVFKKEKKVTNAVAWGERKKTVHWEWANLAVWETDTTLLHSDWYKYTTSTQTLAETVESNIEVAAECTAEMSVWVGGVQVFSHAVSRLFAHNISPVTSTQFEQKVMTFPIDGSSQTACTSDYHRRYQDDIYVGVADNVSIQYSAKMDSPTPWATSAQIRADSTITYSSDGYSAYGGYLVDAMLACAKTHAYYSATADFCDFASEVLLLRISPVTANCVSSRTMETVETYSYAGSDVTKLSPDEAGTTTETYALREPVALIEKDYETTQEHVLLINNVPAETRRVVAPPGDTAWCPRRNELLHFYAENATPAQGSLGALYKGGWCEVFASPLEPTPEAMQAYRPMNPTPFGIEPK